MVPVSLRFSDRWFSVTSLIDSGAAVNLIDGALVEELGIPTFPCVPSLRIMDIDSQPIGEGYLKHQTELLDFRAGLLPRGKPRKLTCTDPARSAFQQLKNCFTMAPILRHPDPDLPFVVEVDASSSGLGEVLSQRHGEPSKLHPCAFYSRKLTSAEVNYNVGNRELLAIKAALEGARHPFQVLTDHRNLEYLRGAKQLNPRASQFEAAQPDVILLATVILAPVQWNLVKEIRRAHADESPPAGCPPTKIFVPLHFRQQVMQWVHEAPSSGHSGIRRSTQLVRRWFWWSSLGPDVEEYVRACSTCAQARTSHLLPEGLLEPLLVPRCTCRWTF
ncbi:hypothetical protein QTP70_010142 [Hemibagrus guttatus]|uniref:Gypsy retrotransposon integrase-like protein 1 n=1 Tax=Hemibagrus guttatus TaxID=175788 RepID=A0AAE0PVE8_9TELE|nr:hypothetical protein QTP70_010142 [Hemibagrus guttatus]